MSYLSHLEYSSHGEKLSAVKDRGATVALTRYRELDVRTVALNSSGNAGGSWALYAARARINCVNLKIITSSAELSAA